MIKVGVRTIKIVSCGKTVQVKVSILEASGNLRSVKPEAQPYDVCMECSLGIGSISALVSIGGDSFTAPYLT